MNAVDALKTAQDATLAKLAALEVKAPEVPAEVKTEDDDILALDDESSDELDLTADDVRAAVQAAVKDTVTVEVRSALNALTGRVD